MCIVLYVQLLLYSGIPYIYGQLQGEVHLLVLSIYRSAIICAKFGVVVLKTSMLRGGQSAMSIYALFYRYRSANLGVVLLKASMIDCLVDVNLPWVYVHCSIYIHVQSLV